jgi:hypothetical protein
MIFNPEIKTPPTDEAPRLFSYKVAASSLTGHTAYINIHAYSNASSVRDSLFSVVAGLWTRYAENGFNSRQK